MTRQRKTPRQIAEERLGVAQRRVKNLDAKVEKAEAELVTLKQERTDAAERLTYAEGDPALTDRTLTEGDDESAEEK